ncbi:MAG: dTDP-4-dehydrorhamnose reductase [Ectothiorhodospiraceae bacterium]|nr:dTDP-4-dehydrorhamnose reductase [Ectothiorhodospiraceae bacterium]
MRILVTGAHGLLGQKIAIIAAQESDHEILLTDKDRDTFFKNPRFDYQQLDITERGDVRSLVKNYAPDAIINTAAITNVDACETEKELSWRVNVDGLKNLIFPAKKLGTCHVVQISSDYVFDGRSKAAYTETDRPNPISYYGKTKLAAENALKASGVSGAALRTQVLYGTGYNVRPNFVTWVLSMLEKGGPFNVVTDQIGNPTFVDDLAFGCLRIAEAKANGIYHVSGSESVSRYEFARAIADEYGFDPESIGTTTSEEIGQAANRPLNSSFSTLKFESEFRYKPANVQQGLARLYQQYREGSKHLKVLFKHISQIEESGSDNA